MYKVKLKGPGPNTSNDKMAKSFLDGDNDLNGETNLEGGESIQEEGGGTGADFGFNPITKDIGKPGDGTDGFYNQLIPQTSTFRSQIYNVKHEDDIDFYDLEQITEILQNDYIYAHKKLKLSTRAFTGLFCSCGRFMEDLTCDYFQFFCGYLCCCYNFMQALFSKSCCWKLCCCFHCCFFKDVDNIPGSKIRKLYRKSV